MVFPLLGIRVNQCCSSCFHLCSLNRLKAKQRSEILHVVKEEHMGPLLSRLKHRYLVFELRNCHVRRNHNSHEDTVL